eukprot:6858067-Prymnesium_polylepis.1
MLSPALPCSDPGSGPRMLRPGPGPCMPCTGPHELRRPLPPRRFMRFEMAVPTQLRVEGGFDIITTQLAQFHAAMRLARALNRTLILPRLRCDERAMAYPCYAWYHRAMGYGGFNFFQKITMPDYCPPYYCEGRPTQTDALSSSPLARRSPLAVCARPRGCARSENSSPSPSSRLKVP